MKTKLLMILLVVATGVFAQNNNFKINNNSELIYYLDIDTSYTTQQLAEKLAYTSSIQDINQVSDNVITCNINKYLFPNKLLNISGVYPFATYFIYAKVIIENKGSSYSVTIKDIYTSPSNTNQIYFFDGGIAELSDNKLEFKTGSKVEKTIKLADASFRRLFAW